MAAKLMGFFVKIKKFLHMKCNIERGKGRTALISKKPQIFSRIKFRRIAFNLLIA